LTDSFGETDLVRVVLADANVLYPRVLRDYLLYAADQEIIAIAWSSQIMAEVTEHLERNVAGFDRAAGERLAYAMNRAFPFAEVEPSAEHWRVLPDMALPDEDDRHVLAAAIAAEATVLCTSNTKDFPAEAVELIGVEVLTPDHLSSVGRQHGPPSTRVVFADDACVNYLQEVADRPARGLSVTARFPSP
jgi:predicted nucleic acid-binding protein